MSKLTCNQTLDERKTKFWAKVDKTGECWLWKGAVSSTGYGVFAALGKMWGAHKFSWFLEHGDIPQGSWVCRKCTSQLCVNPNHLFLGSGSNNLSDIKPEERIVTQQKEEHAVNQS